MLKLFFLCAWLVFGVLPCNAAENWYINLPNEPGTSTPSTMFTPGATILLPDGRQALIQEILPDGDLLTDLGIMLSPEGIVRGDPQNGQAVLVEQPQTTGENSTAPEQEKTVAPDVAVKVPEKAAEPVKQPVIVPKVEKPAQQPKGTAIPETNAPKADERALTLAELLPLTKTAPAKQSTQENGAQKPETKKPDVKKTEPNKPETNKAEKKKPEVKNPEQKKPAEPQKTRVGEELRIPPDAAKTGNLDFLEGCWQGTRPEYFSKRTIRECFCFGANGKNGKRRVFDPLGHRNCIGGTHATLSKSGVLSVTSQGAACDDGERWGQAEMVCQNSGPKTPCSWVFRDANNGRQSYSIPFVRVESCGR